ncbi:hypothetical protein KIPB_015871 [Kipferlia bialata]|uniref:Guanylate-binding protein N-terminal domain-containing protein n=1 Tax=Kipferlia bialata TaxID=797122 RepID=A0A9K3DE05_9EUKA|nr:hypothetical protein KIPB_015871 [Kipferlia bialata]|eukprot:g15871.t1
MKHGGVLVLLLVVLGVSCTSINALHHSDSHEVSVTPEFEALLNSLEDVPVMVAAVIGRNKQGKSFFLNSLLGLRGKDAYPVSSEVEPTTKGVWVSDQPVCIMNLSDTGKKGNHRWAVVTVRT